MDVMVVAHGCQMLLTECMASREERRAVATEFVLEVNANTVCAECGTQPVEWHHFDHCQQPNARVSSLRTQGASVARIQREMDVSTPLCRSCHMKVDGRAQALQQNKPRQRGTVFPVENCSCCLRPAKPLRQGMCSGCYNHHQGLRLRKNPNGCNCDRHHV